jgi:hypothetical protein
MDALSLSHLTYFDATFTINFHRLDHPPFPCTRRLLRHEVDKQVAGRVTLHPRFFGRHHITD